MSKTLAVWAVLAVVVGGPQVPVGGGTVGGRERVAVLLVDGTPAGGEERCAACSPGCVPEVG